MNYLTKLGSTSLAIGLLSACGSANLDSVQRRSLPQSFVPGSFVVTVSSDSTEGDVNELSQSISKDLSCQMVEPQKVNWGGGVLPEGMANTYNLKFEECDLSADKTAAALDAIGSKAMVSSVEAEAKVFATPVDENDSLKSRQGHLPLINRDAACSISDNSSEPIVVAVVDSGVDKDHPDLKDSFYRNELGEVVGANFVGSGSFMNPDKNWDDGDGHGTHVAGLIAATANNSRGVVGVGSCANVKIMPLRALNDDGEGSGIEIERAIKWAADNGAHIINLSLGHNSTTSGTPRFKRSLYDMLARRNIIVFAAAGNDGFVNGQRLQNGRTRWSYPASYDNVIAVAATTTSGKLASFSNRGARIDIAAPGASVLATTFDGRYGYKSGTSMASPVAAGAYALALATAQKGLGDLTDKISFEEAEEILKSSVLSSKPLSSKIVESRGIIDTELMVQQILKKFPAETEEEPAASEPEPSEPTEPATNDDTVEEPAPTTTEPQAPVEPTTFGFSGLEAGQKITGATALRLNNLPTGTRAVYLYWGSQGFSMIRTQGHWTYAQGTERWMLYGNRALTGFAVDSRGRILGRTKIQVQGL